MRPVRNVLSRVRFKMRSFGIDITSILETGYILMVKPQLQQGKPTSKASIGRDVLRKTHAPTTNHRFCVSYEFSVSYTGLRKDLLKTLEFSTFLVYC